MAFAAFIAAAGCSGPVAQTKPRRPRALNCPGCGAALSGGNGCSYCRVGYVEPDASVVAGVAAPKDWRYVVDVDVR